MAMTTQASEQSSEGFGFHLFGRREQVYRGYYHFSQSISWQPAINIYEDVDHFVICVELAGLDQEEIGLEVVGQAIRVQGERTVPIPCDRANPDCVLRIEIDSGRFERAIELPATADMSTATARLDRGFLWITVNKGPTAAAPD